MNSAVDRWLWTPLVLILAIGVPVLIFALLKAPNAETGAAIGKHLPGLRFAGAGGGTQELDLDALSEPIVIVNLWGTWCPPCRQELPEIAALQAKLDHGGQVRVLPISCGGAGPDDLAEIRQQTEAYIHSTGLRVTSYYDPSGSARSRIFTATGRAAFPTTILLDRERVIRGYWLGYQPGIGREAEELAKKLLQEPAEPPK